jgi:hypothetical protein
MQKIIHTQPLEQKHLMNQEPPLRPMEERERGKKSIPKVVLAVFIVLIIAGVGTGYLLSRGSSVSTTAPVISGSGGKAFGSSDTKTFTDSAVGTVEKEGINGEGTHKLIREGGSSQTACMVSSVLDLNEFVGKKVKVYGTTMSAKQCPWLMDVGRIELQ